METHDVGHEQVGGFGGVWKLRKSHVVDGFGEAIYHGQDSVVALGFGETRHEIQGNVGPGSARDW